MRIDWSIAPEWAQWACQEESGRWLWYDLEPEPGDGGQWYTFRKHRRFCRNEVIDFGQKNEEWRDTLQKRPTEEPPWQAITYAPKDGGPVWARCYPGGDRGHTPSTGWVFWCSRQNAWIRSGSRHDFCRPDEYLPGMGR